MKRLAFAATALAASSAHAEVHQCHVLEVELTPAANESTASSRHEPSQIVVWLENGAGDYLDTLYITAQTGRFGLGNRPGRYDFNSGPMWPYGRRVTTFPVWAHRKPQRYPEVMFQNMNGFDQCCYDNCTSGHQTSDVCTQMCTFGDSCDGLPDPDYSYCGENNLSHYICDSSPEPHYCRPFSLTSPGDIQKWNQADAMTCATQAFTDKGKLATVGESLYPPRVDLVRTQVDSMSVDMYKSLAGFDAVSHATPQAGVDEKIVWPLPMDTQAGDYAIWVEVSQAFDHNATYNPTSYPAPSRISWSDYGLPYRGQPSVLYKVPIAIESAVVTASTDQYVGYGDPNGVDGDVRPPDSTITTDTPGSGGSRLQLVSDGDQMYRVRVVARPEFDYSAPGAPSNGEAIDIGTTHAMLRFVAPGDDGLVGKVASYEVRYLANRELTEANFDEGTRATATIQPRDPGQLQTVDIPGLLPETTYWVGIRALDDCFNTGPVTIVKFTTADRQAGEVNACFIATAAYGSIMANDVETLRHFRDATLGRTVMGELAIETYYTFGPAVAGVVGESDLLREGARDLLRPIVEIVRRVP